MGVVWAYLRSVFLRRRWTVLTATPLLVTGWQWLVNHFSQEPSDLRTASVWTAPWWAWAVAFLVCFAVAQFLAWHEEYRKSSALSEELRDLKYPDFSGNIVQINTHPPPPAFAARFSCAVLVVAEIVNTGADSTADRYGLTAIVEGRKVSGTQVSIPETLDLEGAYGIVRHTSADALYNKTIRPISRGSKTMGILWLFFAEVTPQTLDANSLRLSFFDVRKKQWSIGIDGDKTTPGGPMLIPGIRGGLPLTPQN